MYSEKQSSSGSVTPRLVIHGGAGNIVRHGFPVERYEQYRAALLRIVCSRDGEAHVQSHWMSTNECFL